MEDVSHHPPAAPADPPAASTSRSWVELELSLMWRRLGGWLDRLLATGARHPAEPGIPELQRAVLARAGVEPPAAELAAARAATPLARLAERLALRGHELEVLAIALTPHLEPAIDEAITTLSRAQRRGVDLGVVAELLALDPADRLGLLDTLDPSRPLLAHRLIVVDPGEARAAFARQLVVPVDVVAVLARSCELSPPLRQAAQLLRGPSRLHELALDGAARARVTDACTTFATALRRGQAAWVVVWGPRGAGKRTLAAELAAGAGRPLLALDPTAVIDGSGGEQLRRAEREALLHDAVLYIGPLAGEVMAHDGRELARRLRGHRGPIVFGVEASSAPRFAAARPVIELATPTLGDRERLTVWCRALGDVVTGRELDAVNRAFRLSPGLIEEIALEVRLSAVHAGLGVGLLRTCVLRRLRSELGELATLVTTDHRWEDLVLPEHQVARVLELVDRYRLAHQVYGTWRLGTRVSYGNGVIALFSGPPGTGKTMLARTIARELDLDLYQVDLGQVVSKWVGDTEKMLGRLFDLAERAHAVLLFDEADALFGARTKVDSSNDRYANLAVNFLLQRLERYDGVAILTTNLESRLDPALQRRLTIHLRLDLPTEVERAQLWRSFFTGDVPGKDALDFDALASEFELAGGHIRNAAVRAVFVAAGVERPLDMELVRYAAHLELEDMGRLRHSGAARRDH